MEKYLPDESRIRRTVDNYLRVKEKVMNAALKAGRDENAVRLMCVTKTVEPAYINPVLDAGADLIGENRVQEYLGKKDALHLDGVERHLIGHLQTNKVRQIVGEADMIQSVDSLKLATEISRCAERKGLTAEVLVEVNIGGEESKSGTAPEALEELLYAIAALPAVRVRGLMTIPPICEPREAAGYFHNLYQSFIDIKSKRIDNIDMDILSMGMSADYEVAIAEGSNIVRVGSAIFGARQYY